MFLLLSLCTLCLDWNTIIQSLRCINWLCCYYIWTKHTQKKDSVQNWNLLQLLVCWFACFYMHATQQNIDVSKYIILSILSNTRVYTVQSVWKMIKIELFISLLSACIAVFIRKYKV